MLRTRTLNSFSRRSLAAGSMAKWSMASTRNLHSSSLLLKYAKLTTPNGITYEQPTDLFINGEWTPAVEGKTFDVVAPYNEEKIVTLEQASNADVDKAVDAAGAAFPEWSQRPPEERAIIMNKIADLIEEKAKLFASVESWDNGKTLAMAKGDVGLVVQNFRNYAGWANKIYGDVITTDPDHFTFTKKQPVGVCGMVIPWNFPLLMLAWKIAPALAVGCTCVLKSAESTPLTALLFADILNEAGVPKGVVNIVSAFGPVGGHMATHNKIKKIAFTGSTATGRKIMEAAAESNLKKVTLELGGKSPNLVFDDCDFDKTVEQAMMAIFYNSGEVCCAGSRLYVQDTIYDKFIDALKTRVEQLKVGDPFDENTYYGAQTSQAQLDRILSYIKKGEAEGGRIVTGGKRVDGKGYYMEPTIFADVGNKDTVVKEEIFGPVVTVTRFKTVDEAIDLANDNEYGLASGVHTLDLNRAIYVSERLRAGTVWVNTYNDFHSQVPFGGFGLSGIGRELGKENLSNFLEVKSVRIAGILDGAK